MTLTTSGKVVVIVETLVISGSLFTMSPFIFLFGLFAGIATIAQGVKMKPLAVYKPKEPETKTYTLGITKNTKGALSNIKNKGAV